MSQTTLNDTAWGQTNTFSQGVWKSVYVAAVEPASAAITAVAPLASYRARTPWAAWLTAPTRASTSTSPPGCGLPGGAEGVLQVAGEWGVAAASPLLALPPGESAVSVALAVDAAAARLWWPAGLGAQPLYGLNVSWAPAQAAGGPRGAPAATARRLGFRVAALVTGNDTNASWVAAAAGADGSDTTACSSG
jgi:hypothetical protein